jgi:lipoprotein-releasing system ATP-binding protein
MDEVENILTATDIHRSFAAGATQLPVLSGVSLRVRKGEVVAITGASGVGKSTLLHILGGLDRPTSGVVSVSGALLAQQTDEQLAKFRNRKIGFVFQHHYLMEDFSALENVMLPILVAGKSHQEASQRSELLLGEVGLSNRTGHRPKQLSGGEQQRVAVARALANDPEVVLADEPSGNLDTATGRKLHDLLFRLNSESATTFLIATHNLELAECCSRRLEIAAGQMSETERGVRKEQ